MVLGSTKSRFPSAEKIGYTVTSQLHHTYKKRYVNDDYSEDIYAGGHIRSGLIGSIFCPIRLYIRRFCHDAAAKIMTGSIGDSIIHLIDIFPLFCAVTT